jgi:hypothetical protein
MSDRERIGDLTGNCDSLVLRLVKLPDGRFNVIAELHDSDRVAKESVLVSDRKPLGFAIEGLVNAATTLMVSVSRGKIKYGC